MNFFKDLAVLDGELAVPCDLKAALCRVERSQEVYRTHGTILKSGDEGWVSCNKRV